MNQPCTDLRPAALTEEKQQQARALVDPFRSRDHLSAGFGDRPLRLPLRLLHVRRHEFPAEEDLLSLEELDRLCSAFIASGMTQTPDYRRRAAGAAQYHDALRGLVARHLDSRRPRGTDADDQRLATRLLRRGARGAAACAASMSRSIRCDAGKIPRHHALGRSRARCWPASMRRKRPASRSRSTWSR